MTALHAELRPHLVRRVIKVFSQEPPVPAPTKRISRERVLKPQEFHSCENSETRYDSKSRRGVTALHAELRPHLLHRVIKVFSEQLFETTYNTLENVS